ncbi:MAG: transglycosylase SLT domain-containing protein [Burkholderiaceae bacterium]|nr:transglycosylase SLT domain-containing protein [Burkholderiaceae bacterium]
MPTRPSTPGSTTRSSIAALLLCIATVAAAQPVPTDVVVEAREALRKKDGVRLAQLRERAIGQRHPLALWVDYWELGNRLAQAQQADLDAFYARWPTTYVEDRLRNDWLLELGKRRDWANFTREFPRFRMNDDREVSCYELLTEHLAARDSGKELPPGTKARALEAWLAQRELDDGCHQLATALVAARIFSADEVWLKVRHAAEVNKPRAARAAAALVAPAMQTQVAQALDNPALYLNAGATVGTRANSEITALALARMAANDPEVAAAQLRDRWQHRLPKDLLAWAWAQAGRSAALKLAPEATAHYASAWADAERSNVPPAWSDDTLAWNVRAALRGSVGAERWHAVQRAIDHMSEAEQRDPAWRYWRARAMRETAAPGAAGDRQLTQALGALQQLAGELHFYGKLASEDLNQPVPLPPLPAPLSSDERAAANAHPGLDRGLQLIALGLRNEGVREWNFSLRGMHDRALLAAAERACEREVWDRCINTSDRTRNEVDLAQRFPLPYRAEVVAQAGEIGLDPAYVYGLIRQESRFVTDARSQVGASGLMQVMPATARWTARKIGLPFSAGMIADRDVNLRIGTGYLKLVLDDFDGSQLMAAAAYNAGPSRPRRWREGALIEPAIWAENIPFNETRDYVKKVLSNATVYAAILAGRVQVAPAAAQPAAPGGVASAAAAAVAAASSASTPASAPGIATPVAVVHALLPSLKARLGALIGPRASSAPPPNRELP